MGIGGNGRDGEIEGGFERDSERKYREGGGKNERGDRRIPEGRDGGGKEEDWRHGERVEERKSCYTASQKEMCRFIPYTLIIMVQ